MISDLNVILDTTMVERYAVALGISKSLKAFCQVYHRHCHSKEVFIYIVVEDVNACTLALYAGVSYFLLHLFITKEHYYLVIFRHEKSKVKFMVMYKQRSRNKFEEYGDNFQWNIIPFV